MKRMIDTGASGPALSAKQLLDMYFLDARCYLLETAAILDRIERAQGGAEAMKEHRARKLLEACELLRNVTGNRAERFLLLFSEPAGGGGEEVP